MPSTLVHVAVAGLLAAALLGASLDRESVLVVLGATVLVDLDAVLGIVVEGAHRAAFHTYLFPLAVGAVAYADLRREDPLLLRWRSDATRVVGVTLVAVATAAIGMDMVTNGVNAFYPAHDQFYTVDGKALLSNQRGFVQTFVELEEIDPKPKPEPDHPVRTTENTHYSTGVDPTKGAEPKDVERTFLLVQSGRELLLVLVGYTTVGARLREVTGPVLPRLRSRWF